MQVKNHFNRERKSQDFSQPQITDPSFKNMCDINVIMEKFKKTGMLPNFPQKEASFLDATQIPSFLDAHEIVTKAKEEFDKLPAAVRKACDHKIENFEAFITDPKNNEFLGMHGLASKPQKPKKEPLLAPEDIENLRAALKEKSGVSDK